MKSNRGRRSGSLADRTVQNALIRRVLMHWGIYTGVTCVVFLVNHIFFGSYSTESFGSFFSSYLQEVMPFLLVAVFLLPIFLVDTNKLSHRFAGPMIRFRRCMREFADGRTPEELQFRPGDFWHDIASDFNKFAKQFAGSNSSDSSGSDQQQPESIFSE